MTYDYDRLRWFLFVQDKMTKDQLVSFAKSKGISGLANPDSDRNVDFNAKKEVLLNQINTYLRLQEHGKWEEIQRTTEALWKNGWLNYDPEWTPIEPNWEQYSHPTLTINGSNNIEDDDFYKLLMSMEAINEEREKAIEEHSGPTESFFSQYINNPIGWILIGFWVLIFFTGIKIIIGFILDYL